ncbi:MAG TPA: hypothetical protein VHB21_28230, partial [Minicystis sp.]|nr:hypothetical protein [Minicystis sp.]
MKARALTLALVLASALAPRAARADGSADVAAARELFNEASRHAAAGDWERARADYARSYALKHEPVTRYSLGVAQMKTGHLVDALESFRAFLAEADEAPHAAGYVAPAQKAIAELTPRVSRVRIAVTPPAPGLVVTLDAERVPDLVLDRPRLVDPGAHEIVARADGFAEARQRFTVKEGGQAEVRLTLTPSTVTI